MSEISYLAIAYPKIKSADFELIQQYRKQKDELYFDIVDPHFTLVFPVFNINEKDFLKEIKKQTETFRSFEFTIRCATISKDAFSNYYHVFLVPDEGYSKVVKLHDKLYSGGLKNQLRLDIDFVPHIGVGNSLDKDECKWMVDEWNAKDFEIKGVVNEISIIEYSHLNLKELEKITLT